LQACLTDFELKLQSQLVKISLFGSVFLLEDQLTQIVDHLGHRRVDLLQAVFQLFQLLEISLRLQDCGSSRLDIFGV
jgi:hypothetical protein